MYRTSQGNRTLRGAERRLFVESLGMIADFLSDFDYDADIPVFDDLQQNQKIAVLLGVSKALLRDNVAPPPLTATSEAAVAVVYQNVIDRIVDEIELSTTDDGDEGFEEFGDLGDAGPSWRTLVLQACREATELDDLPDAESTDAEQWALLIECLQDRILWDRDWQMLEHLDTDPEVSRSLKGTLGIDEDYYVAVPPDLSDEKAARMLMELRYLTPEGRAM